MDRECKECKGGKAGANLPHLLIPSEQILLFLFSLLLSSLLFSSTATGQLGRNSIHQYLPSFRAIRHTRPARAGTLPMGHGAINVLHGQFGTGWKLVAYWLRTELIPTPCFLPFIMLCGLNKVADFWDPGQCLLYWYGIDC